MRKRILSFILVLAIITTMLPGLDLHASASEIKYTSLTLNVNWDHIKQVGKQAPGSVSCACYALAYARTLLDNTVHRYSEYNLGTNEYDALASWSKGSYSGHYPHEKKDALQIMYSELCTGNPVLVKVKGSRSSHHYVTVVGFENIKSSNDLHENKFLIIDPAVSGFTIENMGGVGYELKFEENNYQVLTDTTNKTVKFEAKEACTHTYSDVGICTKCGNEYNFIATKNTGVAGIYKTTDKITLRTDKPYTASNNKSKDSIAKGKEVTVEYCVTNHYGNTWYYITYKDLKGYVYEDRLTFVKHFDQNITCTITSPTENQSLTKKAHPLIGTVTSTYPIAIINGYLDGQHFVDTKPNATTVDLRSSVINTCLDFGALSPGKHTLELKAHDIHRKDDISIIKRTFYIEAIGPHTCDQGEYLWVWDVHPHYKCYKCSICGEEWANKSEPTMREGCSDCYPPTCKVSLNTNGGSCDKKELIVTDGSNIGDLPTPTLSGYTFDGWYTEPFSGSKVSSSTKITDDMTVYAHWKHAGHKIEFDFADGIRKDAGEVAQLTSINNGRPGGALVVFNEGSTTVSTNVYGWEIAVDEYGAIKAVRKYGDSTQLQVPYGGFVLSGQADSTPGVEGIFGGVLTVINIHEENLNYVYVDYETGKVYAYENYADYVANHKYVADGENYGVLPVPEKEGRYLHYWHPIDNPDGVPYYFGEYCSSNLYAQWRTQESMGPVGFTEFGDHRYEFYEYATSWHEAKLICEAKGGHLVTLTSKEEQEHIAWFANQLYKGLYYIGCSDAANEGTWTWVTGEPFSYTNWDTNSPLQEPSGTEEESYGAIIAKDNPPNKQIGEWIDAPNVKYGSFYDISNCGFICEYESNDEVHEHSYKDTVIQPTCTEQGYTEHKCSCGESFKDTYTNALGHSPELKNEKATTCTTDGYTGDEICKTCGKTVKTGEVIKATDHKWDNGKVTKDPTETTEGIKQFTCTVCEGTKEESIPVTIHKHNFKDTVVAPSCTESGYTEHKCSCGESYKDNYTNALGHTPELKNAKDASCTTDGYTGDEVCILCGKTIKSGEVIKAKGHSFSNGKCTVCGASDPNYKDPTPAPADNPFKDVKDSDWFYAPVLWAVQNGVTGGTSPTTFSPDAHCTRAQVATFLYAAEGKPAVKNTSNDFIDVPHDAWYLNPVLWAKENNITGGIGGGKFGPDQTCTRAQIATFLYKAMS